MPLAPGQPNDRDCWTNDEPGEFVGIRALPTTVRKQHPWPLHCARMLGTPPESWPGLESKAVGKVSKDDCLSWAQKFAADYSASVYNNTVGTLRMLMDIAVEKGVRAQNPAKFITKKRIVQRKMQKRSAEDRA